MLRPGHWCSSASGGVRSALRSGPALQGPTAARGALLVTCSGPGDLQQDPSRLEPTRLPGLVPVSHRLLGARALQSLTGAKQINLREWGTGLGGTLVVDDASHKEEVQQAVRAGTLSFGFSAGGCLFPYYIGCAGALIDGGVLTEGVKVGGASAGSLLAACLKSGMPLDSVVEANLRLMADLRAGGTRGRLGAVVRQFLEERLPEDAHERCRDRAFVAVTRVTPIARPSLVSRFNDREDLIEALITSCHIPWWLDGSAFRMFRGERHCDGGLTNFIPIPPSTVGIRVCCFPSQQLSPVYRIGISPDSFEPWPYTMRQMLQWAFEPADEAIVAAMIDKGRQDASAWMESMDLSAEALQADRAVRHEEGAVSAAKEAVVGTASRGAQTQAEAAGRAALSQRSEAQGAGGEVPAPAAEVQAERQAAGAAGTPLQAVEAAAAKQDEGASMAEQEAAARRALEEAEAAEGAQGNIWARALAAAGAASAAAVAAAALAGGGLPPL